MRGIMAAAIAMLLTFFWGSANAQEKDGAITKDHIVGVIEAHLARLEGWRTGDVLIRMRSDGHGRFLRIEEQTPEGPAKYVEGPDASSVLRRSESLIRMIFDFDQQRALVMIRSGYETEIFDGLDDTLKSPIVTGRDGVALLNAESETAVLSTKNGNIQRLAKVPTAEVFLANSGAPAIKHLGCSYAQLGSWLNSDLSTIFEIQTKDERITDVKHVGKDRYQIVYIGTGGLEGNKTIWEWDLQRQIPIKFWFGIEATGATLSENSVEWSLIEDNYLPVSAKSVFTNIQAIGARHYLIIDEGTIDLHWFSFNSELPEEMFDEKILQNREKLAELMSQEVFDALEENK